jgi:hypothetical protein
MARVATRGILACGQEPVAANIGDIGKIGDAPRKPKGPRPKGLAEMAAWFVESPRQYP